MKRHIIAVLITCCSLWMAGCGAMVKSNKYMSIEQSELEHIPDPGHALVVIKRDNQHVGEYRTQSIWNITDANSPKFIAILSSTMKAAWRVEPGDYFLLQVIAGTRDVVKVSTKADQTYYVMAGPGYWNLKKSNSDEITPDRISINNDEAIAWANNSNTVNSVKSHAKNGMKTWNKLSEEAQAKKTINSINGS